MSSKTNTEVIPSVQTARTVELLSDPPYDTVHMIFNDAAGEPVLTHDAPAADLVAAVKAIERDFDAYQGETPPDSILEGLRKVRDAGTQLPASPRSASDWRTMTGLTGIPESPSITISAIVPADAQDTMARIRRLFGPHLTPPRLTVADLTSHHLGKTVRIYGPHDRWQVTGILYRIDHEAAEVENHTLCDPEPEVTAGRQTVTLKVGPFSLTDDGTDRVEVL